MKRSSIVLPFALLAILGCSGQPAADSSAATESTPDVQTVPDDGATTLVTLKVPNMF